MRLINQVGIFMNNKLLYILILMILLVSGCMKKSDKLVSDGYKFFEENKTDAALEVINRAIKRDKNTAKAYILRGNIYLNKNRLNDSLKDFKKAIEIDKNN